jgi:hypothetical protein
MEIPPQTHFLISSLFSFSHFRTSLLLIINAVLSLSSSYSSPSFIRLSIFIHIKGLIFIIFFLHSCVIFVCSNFNVMLKISFHSFFWLLHMLLSPNFWYTHTAFTLLFCLCFMFILFYHPLLLLFPFFVLAIFPCIKHWWNKVNQKWSHLSVQNCMISSSETQSLSFFANYFWKVVTSNKNVTF